MTFLRFVTFAFWTYYILKLLPLETITFSDALLSDINVVLCYLLSQYRGGGLDKPVSRLDGRWFTRGVENNNMTDCISSLLNTRKYDI